MPGFGSMKVKKAPSDQKKGNGLPSRFLQTLGLSRNKDGKSISPLEVPTTSQRALTVSSSAPEIVEQLAPTANREPKDYWNRAAQKLKEEKPNVYRDFEDLQNGLSDHISMQWLQGAIEEKKEDLSSSDSTTRRNLEKILKTVLLFKDVASAAARFDPFRAAPVAWSGICLVMQVILNDLKQHQEVLCDIARISSTISRWSNVERRLLNRQDPLLAGDFQQFEIHLIDLYASIIESQVAMNRNCNKSAIKRAYKVAYSIDSWQQTLRDITTKDEICKDSKGIIDAEILYQRQNAELLQWFSNRNPAEMHDSIKERTKTEEDYQNCGEWLFKTEEFRSWHSDTTSLDVLWLRGTVGTGKSTLISRVIEWHLERSSTFDGTQIAFFYCSRSTAGLNNDYREVLRSLVRQLSQSPGQKDVNKSVLDLYDDLKRNRPGNGNLKLKECKCLLKSIVSTKASVRVIIDALDECDKPWSLLSVLRDISADSAGRAKFLFSSREDVDVKPYFPECAAVQVNSESTNLDMRTYIIQEIKDKPNNERLLKGEHPELEDKLIEVLSERAGGMFRWVELQLSLFLDLKQPLRHPVSVREKIEELTKKSVAGEAELNSTYADIFDRNTRENNIERQHATTAYQLILCSFRPLRLIEIAHAVALSGQGDFDQYVNDSYLLEICRNFVVKNSQELVEFAHVSVKDFLAAEKIDQVHSHMRAAEICLRSLELEFPESSINFNKQFIRELLYKWSSFHPPTMDSDFFPEYAFAYWVDHCLDSLQLLDKASTLTAAVQKFLSEKSWSRFSHMVSQIGKDGQTLLLVTMPSIIHCLSKDGDVTFPACVMGLKELLSVRHGQTPDLIQIRNINHETPLLVACRYKNLEVAHMLVEWGATTETPDGPKALLLAAQKGFDEMARLLLDNQVNVNAVGTSQAPIIEAARGNHIKLVETLLKAGADASWARFGETALHVAARKDNVKLCELLIQFKAEINVKGQCGKSPLHLAAQAGHFSSAELLLSSGASTSVKDENGDTVLLAATKNGNIQLMDMMVRIGASIHERNKVGETTLHTAARWGHCNVIEWLLCRGACPAAFSCTDNSGRTPLHIAAANGRVEAISLLIKYGWLMDAKDSFGFNPLHYAARYGPYDAVKSLLDDGARPTDRSRRGVTAIHAAVMSGRDPVPFVTALLQRGSSITERDDEGHSPLLWSLRSSPSLSTVSFLLRQGAKLTEVIGDGRGPLHCYMDPLLNWSGHFNAGFVQNLLDGGADINAVDSYGRTPLHYLLGRCRNVGRRGAGPLLGLLLSKRASIFQSDQEGYSALDYAFHSFRAAIKHCSWFFGFYEALEGVLNILTDHVNSIRDQSQKIQEYVQSAEFQYISELRAAILRRRKDESLFDKAAWEKEDTAYRKVSDFVTGESDREKWYWLGNMIEISSARA